MTLCEYMKENGKRCKTHAMRDSKFCFRHDPRPSIKRKAKQASGKGGHSGVAQWEKRIAKYMRNIDLSDPNTISVFLDKLMAGCVSMKMSQGTIDRAIQIIKYKIYLMKFITPDDSNDPHDETKAKYNLLPDSERLKYNKLAALAVDAINEMERMLETVDLPESTRGRKRNALASSAPGLKMLDSVIESEIDAAIDETFNQVITQEQEPEEPESSDGENLENGR